MRRSSAVRSHPLPGPQPVTRRDWQTVRTLFPYLWAYRGRVLLALACLVTAKFANVGVPLVFKHMIDALTPAQGMSAGEAALIVPVTLVAAYGTLRFSVSMFTELREIIFARVTQQAVRNITLRVFRHLHALSLRFHLERQTGGLTRDIERGTRSIGSLIGYTIYSILPTLVEVTLVLGILATRYEPAFALITFATLEFFLSTIARLT